jgi:glycosyltransferase involved in cell wall biosynthesis
MISAVIAAYNEEKTVGKIVKELKQYVDEVIVVDDCSSDKTAKIAIENGAVVISNEKNLGQFKSLKKGMKIAKGDIIVNLDADGEHNLKEIPKLLKPIIKDEAGLTIGKRKEIPRPSERWIDYMVKIKTKEFIDTGSGFRAIKKSLADKLELKGLCVCGILVLEALKYGAIIKQVPISVNENDKKRSIAWQHFFQFFIVLRRIL